MNNTAEFLYAECACGEVRRSPVFDGDTYTAAKWLRFKMWKHVEEEHRGN